MELNQVATKKTLLEKLKLFFVKPSELFRDYLVKPAWALKLTMIALISAAYTYEGKILSKDLIAEMMREKTAAMSPEQAEASMSLINSPIVNIMSTVGAVISIIVIVLLISLIYMAFIRAFNGKIKYSQVVSVYTLAYMAVAIGMAVKLAYMYLTGNLLFLDLSPTLLDALYNNLDPFIIWQAVLMVFGISIVSGISEKKSTIIVASMWLVSLAISLGSVMLMK